MAAVTNKQIRKILMGCVSGGAILVSVPVLSAEVTNFGRNTEDIHVQAHKQGVGEPNTIIVKSNGQKYTIVKNFTDQFEYHIRVHILPRSVSMPHDPRIKSYKAWPGFFSATDSQNLELESYGFSKSWGPGKRPRKVEVNKRIDMPASTISEFAIRQCNNYAHNMRNEGKHNKTIFEQDHDINIRVYADSTVKYTKPPENLHEDNEYDEAYGKLVVRCAKTDKPAALVTDNFDSGGPGYVVEQASLHVLEKVTFNGVCRAHLSSVIKTVNPNTSVRFRYRHTNAKSGETRRSEIYEVTTDHAGMVTFDHQFDVPNEAGTEEGFFVIEGKSATFETDVTQGASYEMDCADNAIGGVQAQLPPIISFNHSVAETVSVGNLSCPSKLVLYAKIEGRGNFLTHYSFRDGAGASFGGGHSLQITSGKTEHKFTTYNLDWSNIQSGPLQITNGTVPEGGYDLKQDIALGFRLYNGNTGNNVLAEIPLQDHLFECNIPDGVVKPHIEAANTLSIQEVQLNDDQEKKVIKKTLTPRKHILLKKAPIQSRQVQPTQHEKKTGKSKRTQDDTSPVLPQSENKVIRKTTVNKTAQSDAEIQSIRIYKKENAQ